MKKRSIQIAKWLWSVLVFAAAAWYAWQNWHRLREHLTELRWDSLALSLGLVIAGKLILAELARWSLGAQKSRYTHREMLYLCSLSQLGKYLPGGIWHLVGRGAFYKAHGLPMAAISKALLIENLWLLISAAGFGASLCFFAAGDRWVGAREAHDTLRVSGGAAIIVLWWLGIVLVTRAVYRGHCDAQPSSTSVFLGQLLVWLCLGGSLAALIPGVLSEGRLMLLAPGALALGWAAGYVAPFAPAGLGVREAGTVALLAAAMPVEQATVLAAVARLVWTVAELLLGAIGYFGHAKMKRPDGPGA